MPRGLARLSLQMPKSNRRRAVAGATNAHVQGDVLAALASRTAESAYQQATRDLNFVRRLVDEVARNCMAACEHLR